MNEQLTSAITMWKCSRRIIGGDFVAPWKWRRLRDRIFFHSFLTSNRFSSL